MKTLKLIALAACALLFSQCKTTAPTGPSGPAPTIVEVNQILDSTQIMFIQFADQTNGDAKQSIALTTNWLSSLQNVQSASSIDSTYIDITLKSGITTTFNFNAVDDKGYSIFRGGGAPDAPEHINLSGSGTLSKNKIDNKKVLIFAADTKTLLGVEPQIQKTLGRFTNSGLGLDITVLRDEQCTYNVVEHFGDYGLVIMDTHGGQESFLLGTPIDFKTTTKNETALKAALTGQVGTGAYDKVISGDLILGSIIDINLYSPNWWKTVKGKSTLLFSGKFIDQLPPMPNTVIFGNMCYSGWSLGFDGRNHYDHPIKTAFTNRNLISYYGYVSDWRSVGNSRPVPDVFATQMEDVFVQRLIENTDSTKIANLQPDNKTEFNDPEHFDPSYGQLWGNLSFRHWGADNYSYEKGCVSQFTDDRDGQVYKAVCIGKQNWMAQNLNYDVPGSECYDSLTSNCEIYGKLYRRSMVMNGAASSNANPSGVQGICPKGWHVPSTAEWNQLITFLGGPTKAGGALKSTSDLWSPSINKVATNSSGFSALPSGEWVDAQAAATSRLFFSLHDNAFFHTASETLPNQIDMLYLDNNSTNAAWITEPTTIPPVYAGNVACRCLKD